ncbi:hypothetical protein NDU88_000956 [Pleurodeles waltl]|uniref:Uncharacterized protein n=1 Tax=Pleurodeles waltl TaxID=8319 RepID=A0AAV7UTY8_PLEWA|nr:hypothetical protein NDU88_000956 [Pleurodeles waltl]
MADEKVLQPLRLLQEASRLDLLAENMCVEGQPMSRVAAGVTVAVIPCLRLHTDAKSGWQLNGRSRSWYRRAASGGRPRVAHARAGGTGKALLKVGYSGEGIKKVFYYAIVKRNRLPTKCTMEPNKVVQALKVLQDEGREDLIKEGVLEEAWVGLRRPKRLSSGGVMATVIACSSPQKKLKKCKSKSAEGRKVTRSPELMQDVLPQASGRRRRC